MRLALRILRPHSLTLTLTLSLSHCLSHLSHLSHLFLISLISLSSLSLSPLCLSSFRLSSLAGGSGQRATYKGLFTPASKKSAVFFPTSLPSTFPFWSASFRPPLGLKFDHFCVFPVNSSQRGTAGLSRWGCLRTVLCQEWRLRGHRRGGLGACDGFGLRQVQHQNRLESMGWL